jgi:hypothetical protein
MSIICNECIKRGRYSKSNLLIDFREVKHQIETAENIMGGDYILLCEAKNEILKRLLDRSLICNCK